jgi:radical SAM superfamily enzyme YgiQ (UPF0313 family)
MHYEGNIIRPPSEANSILLQVTNGCSHNKCTFCGAYKGERFKIKDNSIIEQDIDYAATYFREQKRLFLCDGDALIIKQEKLLWMLREIKAKLPWVNRVGTYANAKSLKRKSLKELEALNRYGLGIIYMGVESGDDETLQHVNKKATSLDLIEQGIKVRKAGIKLSVTVLLGLAGIEKSLIHARKTGEVLSQINPNYIGALTLMLVPGTPLYDEFKNHKFVLPDQQQMLLELYEMIRFTELNQGLFLANHASNYLPVRARLPRDKDKVLGVLKQAIDGNIKLKPEWLRAL